MLPQQICDFWFSHNQWYQYVSNEAVGNFNEYLFLSLTFLTEKNWVLNFCIKHALSFFWSSQLQKRDIAKKCKLQWNNCQIVPYKNEKPQQERHLDYSLYRLWPSCSAQFPSNISWTQPITSHISHWLWQVVTQSLHASRSSWHRPCHDWLT